jgi:hypothetical protein
MPINITDTDEFTATVQAPADGDPHRGASYELSVQQLANRTRNLANRLGEADGSGEFVYTNATGTPIAKTRTIVLGCDQLSIPNLTGDFTSWLRTDNFSVDLVSASDGVVASLDLNTILPSGAVLNVIEVLVNPGAARTTTNRMEVHLYAFAMDFATPAAPSPGLVDSSEDDGTTNLQVVRVPSSGSLAETIDAKNSTDWVIKVQSGSDSGSNVDTIHAVRLTFDDPGPRND